MASQPFLENIQVYIVVVTKVIILVQRKYVSKNQDLFMYSSYSNFIIKNAFHKKMLSSNFSKQNEM